MKGVLRHGGILRLGVLAVWLCSAVSVRANPDAFSYVCVDGIMFGGALAVILAIVAEAFCVSWMLRHLRTPRRFVLWIIGMHLVTYPVFLGVLWLLTHVSNGPLAVVALLVSEALILVIEGILAYLICLRVPAKHPDRVLPSIRKCVSASLIGNLVSYAAFPVLAIVCAFIGTIIIGVITYVFSTPPEKVAMGLLHAPTGRIT